MTMPENAEFIEDEPQEDDQEQYTVAVKIVENAAKITREAIADFGNWVTYNIVNTTIAFPILNRNPRRDKATLIVSATVAAQIVTDGVMVGTLAQCMAGKGGFIPIGQRVTVQNQQQLYAGFAPTAQNPVNLTVLDEVYYGE